MIPLKCQCCGFERVFSGPEEPFRENWDAPPHFPYVTCELCSVVDLMCLIGHPDFQRDDVKARAAAHLVQHALWEQEGRPASPWERVETPVPPPAHGYPPGTRVLSGGLLMYREPPKPS